MTTTCVLLLFLLTIAPTDIVAQSDKSNTLTLTETGTGDLADLAAHLKPERASFAYARVKYANDEHSFREKFILVIWIGEDVKVMRRAKVSVHAADVKKVLSAYSFEVNASSAGDLSQVSLARAGSADLGQRLMGAGRHCAAVAEGRRGKLRPLQI